MPNPDTKLKKALRAYTKAVLRFLHEIPLSYDVERAIMFYIPRIDAFEDEKEAEIPILQLDEARSLKAEMKAHPILGEHIGTAVGTEMRLSRLGVWSVFQSFLLHLIRHQRSLVYDGKAFSKTFDSMMSFFRSSSIPVQFVAMLENVDMFSDDDITFENGWQLKQISMMLKDDLTRIVGDESLQPSWESITRHALMKVFQLEKITMKPGVKRPRGTYKKIQDEVETTITAFRLTRRGGIVRRPLDYQILGWHPFECRSMNDYGPLVESKRKYVIAKEDSGKTDEILGLLSYLKSRKKLRIPLRRLELATERKESAPEDRILDTMIAFESLFGEGGEMRYRLSLRVAVFLGESEDERRQLKDDFSAAYQLRSDIVHGRKTSAEALERTAEMLEDSLRRTLVKYMKVLRNGKSHREVIQSLEEMILNDASRGIDV